MCGRPEGKPGGYLRCRSRNQHHHAQRTMRTARMLTGCKRSITQAKLPRLMFPTGRKKGAISQKEPSPKRYKTPVRKQVSPTAARPQRRSRAIHWLVEGRLDLPRRPGRGEARMMALNRLMPLETGDSHDQKGCRAEKYRAGHDDN